MPKKKDVLWEHITLMDDQKQKVMCKFCSKIISGGITRMRYHFSKLHDKDVEPCMKVPASVQAIALDGVRVLERKDKKRRKLMTGIGNVIASSSTTSIESDVSIEPTDIMEQEKKKMEADKAFARWALSHSIPLDWLKSPYFLKACELALKNGPEYQPLSSDFRRKKLVSEFNYEASSYVESVKRSCSISGCTLIIDRWTRRATHYVIVMAVSLEQSMLLKSACSAKLVSSETIEDLTSSAIKAMGPQNVVQALAPNGFFHTDFEAKVYSKTGVYVKTMLKPTFVNAIRGIRLTMFFRNVYRTAKKIVELLDSNLRYRYLMKTLNNGQTLLQCRKSQYKTLELVLKEKKALQDMFGSEEMDVRDPIAADVKKMVERTEFWEQGKKIMILVKRLFSIVRMLDDHTANLGYIYHACLKVREATEVFLEEMGSNREFWVGIYNAIAEQMDSGLYIIGAYLNPHLFYDREVKLDNREIDALEDAIRLMVPFSKRDVLVKELKDYRAMETNIFGEVAIKSVRMLHPRLWWERWGGAVPTLQGVAIKILSQPCSFKVSPELRSIIQATHAEENYLNPVEWEELLGLRVHSHLMGRTRARTKEADSRPIFLDESDVEDYQHDLYSMDEVVWPDDEIENSRFCIENGM